MKKYNLWKSVYTNEVYEMPVDWLPIRRLGIDWNY